MHRVHIARRRGVKDWEVEPAAESSSEKRAVQERALRDAEAHVGHAEHRAHPEALFDKRHCLHDFHRFALICGDGHDEAVDHDVLAGDADALGFGDDLLGNGKTALGCRRDTRLVKSEPDDRTAVFLGERQHGVEALALAVYGIDQRLSCVAADHALDGVGVARVDDERQRHRGRELFDDGGEHGGLVELRKADVHVEHIGA